MNTPGRKPMSAATPREVAVIEEALTSATQAADQFRQLQASYGEERDLLNQLLGQAQMADAISKFSRTVRLSKLAYVKEHKLYQQLAGKQMPNGSALRGTWEEFCILLGYSKDKVDLDLQNLHAFGEEALESMSSMGIGYRELRQYRKLPEDQKQALIEVAKAGDKEGFVELAEEIIAKHAKEKETLAAQVKEAQAEMQAKDRVLATRNDQITGLQDQIAAHADDQFKPPQWSVAKTADEQKLVDELQVATATAQTAMRRLFVAADTAIEGGAREAIVLLARQSVEYLCQQLLDITTEFGIDVDLEERLRPSWLNEEALAAMEARQAAAKK